MSNGGELNGSLLLYSIGTKEAKKPKIPHKLSIFLINIRYMNKFDYICTVISTIYSEYVFKVGEYINMRLYKYIFVCFGVGIN